MLQNFGVAVTKRTKVWIEKISESERRFERQSEHVFARQKVLPLLK
jgi:hypothetical protein